MLGDYSDHQRRKKGRKDQDHYKLDRFRSLHWSQSPEQRFRTLLAAGAAGFPELLADPIDLLHQFRGRYGPDPTHADFLEWYRANHPVDYATSLPLKARRRGHGDNDSKPLSAAAPQTLRPTDQFCV